MHNVNIVKNVLYIKFHFPVPNHLSRQEILMPQVGALSRFIIRFINEQHLEVPSKLLFLFQECPNWTQSNSC